MMNKISTRGNIFLYSIFILGGKDGYVSIEDVYKKAHELLPSAFSWEENPELPSDRKINKTYHHIREKVDKNLIISDKKINATKLKLSTEATQYIEENEEKIISELENSPIKVSTKSSNEDLKILEALQGDKRVKDIVDKKEKLKEDLIMTLLEISSFAPVNIKIKKILNLIITAENNKASEDIVNFLQMCKDFYE